MLPHRWRRRIAELTYEAIMAAEANISKLKAEQASPARD